MIVTSPISFNADIEAPETAVSTYNFVAASVLFVGVGTVTVPVKVGDARFAFRSRAVC